jgi:hypothetical protein
MMGTRARGCSCRDVRLGTSTESRVQRSVFAPISIWVNGLIEKHFRSTKQLGVRQSNLQVEDALEQQRRDGVHGLLIAA